MAKKTNKPLEGVDGSPVIPATDGELTPAALFSAKQRMEIVNLRVAGWSQPQIAQHYGVKQCTISNILNATIKKWNRLEKEGVEELRRMELARLDEYLRALWPSIVRSEDETKKYTYRGDGRARAVEVALKIGERRAKLLGLDAPEKTDLTVSGTVQRMDPSSLVEEAKRLGLPMPDDFLEITSVLPGLIDKDAPPPLPSTPAASLELNEEN